MHIAVVDNVAVTPVGTPLTVTVVTAVFVLKYQPEPVVYVFVMVAVPGATAVTTPVALTVATDALLVVQVPP